LFQQTTGSIVLLTDRTSGRAYVTVLCLSVCL